jgi:rRNA maturation protein Nop10
MKDKCPVCKHNTLAPQPPKYSPLDKYAKYRRMATLEERKKEDLL